MDKIWERKSEAVVAGMNKTNDHAETTATVLFSKQKLLNRLLITHDHRLLKHCISSNPLTPPRGRLTGVKLG